MSIVDQVTVLLTVPESKKLEAIGDATTVKTWTHPLLKQIECRMTDLNIPAQPTLWGYFLATFTLKQHYDPNTKTLATQNISAQSSKKKAKSIFDDMSTDLNGLDSIPGQTGTDLTSALSSMTEAFEGDGGILDVFDQIDDATASWRDLSRSLDVFSGTVGTFVDSVRAAEEFIGDVSYDIQRAPLLVTQTVRNAVDNAKSAAVEAATFTVNSTASLFNMMVDAGVELTEEAISTIMLDSGIDDPLMVQPGTVVIIPLTS
jgi:hypothetical protein